MIGGEGLSDRDFLLTIPFDRLRFGTEIVRVQVEEVI